VPSKLPPQVCPTPCLAVLGWLSRAAVWSRDSFWPYGHVLSLALAAVQAAPPASTQSSP
jgi:hypothetical protein